MDEQSHLTRRHTGATTYDRNSHAYRIDVARPCGDSGVFRNTVLRSTLFGEYVSLMMMSHSLFGTVCWAAHVGQNPSAMIMVAAGLWIAFRAVGGFSGEQWAAGVSILTILMTGTLAITGVANVPPWLSGSFVAPIFWTVMLGVVLVADFIDCRKRSHLGLSLSERRKRDGQTLKIAAAVLFLAWGLGVPAAALIRSLAHQSEHRIQMEEMSFVQHVAFRCGEAIVTTCFFALGANIGSFLNVVVWRMPLGKSIVHGDSRCPVCSTKIASRDNIPIFGWLGLGGQCRACHTEISPRYPIVEAITGGLFLLLYFVELISGGANLPFRAINTYRGVLWIIMYPKWDLIGLYLFHCFVFSTLLVWMLMAIDKSRIPRNLFATSLCVAMIAPVIFPSLAIVPCMPLPASAIHLGPLPFIDRVVREAVGAIGGLLCGFAVVRLLRQRTDCFPAGSILISAMALLGAAFGWQAVVCIASGFVIVARVRRLAIQTDTGRFNVRIAAQDLMMVAVFHHLIWRFVWVSTANLS